MSVAGALAVVLAAAPPGVDPEVLQYWGADNVRILREATQVELFRVIDHYQERKLRDLERAERIAGYVIRTRKSVPVDKVRPLVDLLLSGLTYSFSLGNKLCGGFQPGVAVRFTAGDASTVVLLCFLCSDVGWSREGVPRLRGEAESHIEDISPGVLEILEAVVALFPLDKDLSDKLAERAPELAELRALYESFPPAVRPLLRMKPSVDAEVFRRGELREKRVAAAGESLFKAMAPDALLAASFEALGAGSRPWDGASTREEVVIDAASRVTREQFESAVAGLGHHPAGRRGAARLFFERLAPWFEPPRRAALGVSLARPVFDDLPEPDKFEVVAQLSPLDDELVVDFMKEVVGKASAWVQARGAIQMLGPRPSAGAAALWSTARAGKCPPGPTPDFESTQQEDRPAISAALAWCGDGEALTVDAFRGPRLSTGWVIEAIVKRPTRRHVDLLVAEGVDSERGARADSISALRRISEVAGLKDFPKTDGVAGVKRWWSKYRAGWKGG